MNEFLFTDYGFSFEIKGSKLKFSVKRVHLFKVVIVLSTLIIQGCAICSSDSSFLSSPSVITSAGFSENSETIYSTDNSRDWSRSRT